MNEGPKNLDNLREAIINHNLGMMNGRMLELLLAESINGNAGIAHTESGGFYSSAVANGRVDTVGRIIAFDNIQNIPGRVIRRTGSFSFHVTFDKLFRVHKIIFLDNKVSELTPRVMDILRDSMLRFNEAHKKPKN